MRERFPGVTFVLDVQGKLTQMSVAKSAARAGATMKYFVKDERDVAAWGMTLVNVWSLFHLYPEQWRYQRYLAWLPLFRNAVLFIEARLY